MPRARQTGRGVRGTKPADAAAVEAALRGARVEAGRLALRHRSLVAVALTLIVVSGARGVLGGAQPQSQPAPALAFALGAALVAAIVIFVRAMKTRDRLEHLMRDIQSLETSPSPPS